MKQAFASFMVLVTVILMDILGGAEVDLFVPSFPELQSQFGLSPFWVEALLSVNFIGFCLSLFFVGGLADRYGRKPIITLGLMVFIVGSSLCLWATSYPFLIVGRFLQGIGVAAPATLCFLIIADTYPLKQQQYLMAMLNGLINVSVAAAPLVGSYVTLYFHWQGNFAALLISGLVVLIMVLLFISAHPRPEHKGTLSFRGYLPIFESKSMMLMIVSIMFMFVPYWIFIGMSPILYMKELGVSLTHFGYYQGSLAFTFAFGSVLSGWIISKFDQKKLLYISGLLCIAGLIMMVWVCAINSTNPLLITLAYLPYNFGTIIPSAIIYPICINFIPEAKGRVAAVINAGKLMLTAIGLECAGYFYTGSFRNIGMIIAVFFLVAVVTLFLVIRNRELMQSTKS